MFFQRVELTHFRCHTALGVDLAPGLTALVGRNGVGKTAVLEALHCLAFTRGFRPDRELVQRGAAYVQVVGRLAPGYAYQTLTYAFVPERGKRLLYDQLPAARLADHLGRIPVVAVLPDDTRLVQGSGTDRRAWLDGLLAQQDAHYLAALTRYQRALEQRNALLAQAEGHAPDPALLAHYDGVLAEATGPIVTLRRAFLAAFSPQFHTAYRAIAQTDETPGLAWVDAVDDPSPAAVAEALAHAQRADRAAGRTTWGLHREDMTLLLGGLPVRSHGSQGQRKTYLLALKLAQYAYLHAALATAPLLLLDDVCDRLDEQRIGALFAYLATHVTGQTVVTDTSEPRIRAAVAATGLPEPHVQRLG